MAYEEYDYYNEPATGSLKESLYDILHSLTNKKHYLETAESLKSALQLTPNVSESLGRGGVAQAIGTSGDLRELRNTINSYLPKSVHNFTQAAEFLANPYATAIQQIAPTTEETLEFVPRVTAPYEGYRQHETLGEYIAPSLGYFGAKALKAGKDLPGGLSIMGPESKLWQPEMEFQARKLEAKGATPEEILEKTGLVRGLDERWRSEISDLPSQMKEGETFGEIHRRGSLNGVWQKDKTTVKDVLEHPQLFEAYPHLGDVEVRPHGAEIPARGSYNQNKNLITLREDLTPSEAKSVILHELTHGVQGTEEFNRGASAAQLTDYYAKQKQGLMTKIEELNGQMSEAYKADDMDKYRQLITQRDVLSRRYTNMNPEELGYEDYFKHAGEAEARMVQKRMALSPEELRKRFPYQYTGETGYGLDINPDEAIITTKQPGTINMPEQSIEPPKSKQDELGFHSALENAVSGIKQPKGTGEQFLKQLEKTPGVKTEELEVTGLKKYLQDNKFVTKQEVNDFIENNRLKLENKVLDENNAGADTYDEYSLQGGDVYHDDEYIRSLADDLHHDLTNDPDVFIQEKEALLERYPELYEGHDTNPYMDARLNQDVEDALWEQAKTQAETMYYEDPIRHYYDDYGYDIYGNDNTGYSVKDPNGRFLDLGSHYDISDAEDALRQHLLDQGVIDIGSEGGPKYADYVLPGSHENYREVLTTYEPKRIPPNYEIKELPKDFYDRTKHFGVYEGDKLINTWHGRENAEDWLKGAKENYRDYGNYESGHFDEPNILAHMRVNDRTINGKKTLFVEEIQSDWHQSGRKKGYKTPINFDEKIRPLTEQDKNIIGSDEGVMMKMPDDTWGYMPSREQAIDYLTKKEGYKVPDAPFKKNWHEMMVKQALDMAAKGDYDAVAFTTGKQQAERYNLAKQVDEIRYKKTGGDQYAIAAIKNGHEVVVKENLTPNQLSDYLGNEISKKIIENEGNKVVNEKADYHALSGVQLEVGGEGMKGFYDKIVPDFINKYTKKWGMGMKKADILGERDLGVANVNRIIKEAGYTKEEFDKLPGEKRMEILEAGQPKEPVHFVELSDAAKKDIKEKGQPLFAGLGLTAGTDYMMEPDDQMKTGIFKDLMKAKK